VSDSPLRVESAAPTPAASTNLRAPARRRSDVANLLTRLSKLITSPAVSRRTRRGAVSPSRAAAEDGLVLGLGVLMIWAVVAWVQNSVNKED
jgi:hypothetical protein